MKRSWNWGILAILLLTTLVGAMTLDRSKWPYLVGDEATYAMQAASLAWDLDLRYSRRDYERFVEQWGRAPEGLILQSRNGGERLTYGKPALYALAVAPFVRLSPVNGALVGNALFLAAAALLAAWVLERRLGPAAPLWVAAFVFASVAFGYAFWVHADLFLMAATAAAFALAYRGEHPYRTEIQEVYEGEVHLGGGRFFGWWFAVGALAAIPGAFRPFYLALLIPLALAVPEGRRWRGLGSLTAGALAVLLLAALLQWGSGGSWSGYGGERQDFYPETGYPEVDFPAERWSETLERRGNKSWIHEETLEFRVDRRLWAWNSLYFLLGRDVGILLYYLPLLLSFLAYGGIRGRWAIVPAILLAAAGFFFFSPFNFYGGAGALGNRYFLPLYPALWFVAARPRRPEWALVAAALATPFLWPLWSHPRAFPVDPGDGRYRHVSQVAERWLPYETTQSHIPGGRDVQHQGLWVRFLNDAVWPADGGQSLRLMGGARGEILVASPDPLEALWLDFQRGAPSKLEVGGGDLDSTLFRPDGSVVFQVAFDGPRARHPMWWTWETVYLYLLRLRLSGASPVPYRFSITPEGAPQEEVRP